MAQDYLERIKKKLKDKYARREGAEPADMPAPQDNSDIQLDVEEPTFAGADARSPMDQLRQAIRDTDRNAVGTTPQQELTDKVKQWDQQAAKSQHPAMNVEPDAMEMPARAWVERANKMSQPAAQEEAPIVGPPPPPLKQRVLENDLTGGPDVAEAAPLDVSTDFQPLADKAPQVHPDDPPESSLPNKDLGAGINATSAATSTEDVAKAMERPHGVKDESAYWAALKGIALAFQPDNQAAGGFYDAKIHENQQAQADWKAQTAAALKQKFATDQLNATKAHYGALEAQARTNSELERDKLTETSRHNKAMEGRPVRGSSMTEAQTTSATNKVLKELPGTSTVNAFNRLMTRINDPKPITGWDTAAAVEAIGTGSRGIPLVGPAIAGAGETVAGGIRGMAGEAADIAQDAETVINGLTNETSGLAFSQNEVDRIKRRLGTTQGEESFRRGVTQEMQGLQDKTQRWFDAQPPEVQARLLQNSTILPQFVQPRVPVEQMPKHQGTLDKLEGLGRSGMSMLGIAQPPTGKPAAQEAPQAGNELSDFVTGKGFEVTQGPGGNYSHSGQNAVDVRVRGKSPQEIEQLMSEAKQKGYQVLDERQAGSSKGWSGPHIHIQKALDYSKRRWGSKDAVSRAKSMENEDARRQAREDADVD